MSMRTEMIAVFLPFLTGLAVTAQDWTRFRGSNGTGISQAKGVPVKWTESDYLWRAEIPGTSHSQPVIWGDKIFVTSALNKGRERTSICLDKKNGEPVWHKKYTMETHRKHRLNSYASSSPAVDAKRVCASFVTPDRFLVMAWDHAGEELWSREFGSFDSQHGHGASPIILEGKVIVVGDQRSGSFITALDARSGKDVWTCERRNSKKTAYGTPCLIARDGKKELLTVSLSHGISSLDFETGELNWEALVFDKRPVASPVVAGDLVFGSCGAGGGGNYLVAVRLGGEGDVTTSHTSYEIRRQAPYVPTPVAIGNRLYFTSDRGIATCVEADSGRVIWQERLAKGFFGSPVWIDGKIYCNSMEGETLVFEAEDTFKLLAKNPLLEESYSTPCVDGNRLYIKTFSHLICVGEE